MVEYIALHYITSRIQLCVSTVTALSRQLTPQKAPVNSSEVIIILTRTTFFFLTTVLLKQTNKKKKYKTILQVPSLNVFDFFFFNDKYFLLQKQVTEAT